MRKFVRWWIILFLLNVPAAFAVTNREVRDLLTSVRELLEIPNLFLFEDQIPVFFAKETELIRLTIEMVSNNEEPDDRAWLDAFLRIDAMWTFQNEAGARWFVPAHRFQILNSLIWEWKRYKDPTPPGALYTGPKILDPSFAGRLRELLETELEAIPLQEQYWNIVIIQAKRLNERTQIDTQLAAAVIAPTCQDALLICDEILTEYPYDLNTLQIARQSSRNLPSESHYLRRILDISEDFIGFEEKNFLQVEKFLSVVRLAELYFSDGQVELAKRYLHDAFIFTLNNGTLLYENEIAKRYFALVMHLNIQISGQPDFDPPAFSETAGSFGPFANGNIYSNDEIPSSLAPHNRKTFDEPVAFETSFDGPTEEVLEKVDEQAGLGFPGPIDASSTQEAIKPIIGTVDHRKIDNDDLIPGIGDELNKLVGGPRAIDEPRESETKLVTETAPNNLTLDKNDTTDEIASVPQILMSEKPKDVRTKNQKRRAKEKKEKAEARQRKLMSGLEQKQESKVSVPSKKTQPDELPPELLSLLTDEFDRWKKISEASMKSIF